MPSEVELTPAERLAWRAIQDNIELAQDFVRGMSAEAFAQDRRTFYAVTRCLEIISEAARRLGTAQKDASPQLEWRQIEDLGNVFRHALSARGREPGLDDGEGSAPCAVVCRECGSRRNIQPHTSTEVTAALP